jgi:hypothetical protein
MWLRWSGQSHQVGEAVVRPVVVGVVNRLFGFQRPADEPGHHAPVLELVDTRREAGLARSEVQSR